MNVKDMRSNGEGYNDPTAFAVVKKDHDGAIQFHSLLNHIKDDCTDAGFKVSGHIVLIDSKTGKIWR